MKRHLPIPEHQPHPAAIGQQSHPNTGAAPHASHSRGGFSRPDSFSQSSSGFISDAEHHQFYTKSPNLEAQWQWERERDQPQNNLTKFSSPRAAFHEGQGGEATRPYYHRQKPESKLVVAQINTEQRYEESSVPSTLDGLERKIMEELLILSKEQYDSEDTEIKRHKDRIMEINARFHEKLMALRSKMNSQREEVLIREAQLRGSQVQHMGIRGSNQIQQMGNQFDSHRDRMDFSGRSDVRASFDGRGYGDGGARYY